MLKYLPELQPKFQGKIRKHHVIIDRYQKRIYNESGTQQLSYVYQDSFFGAGCMLAQKRSAAAGKVEVVNYILMLISICYETFRREQRFD